MARRTTTLRGAAHRVDHAAHDPRGRRRARAGRLPGHPAHRPLREAAVPAARRRLSRAVRHRADPGRAAPGAVAGHAHLHGARAGPRRRRADHRLRLPRRHRAGRAVGRGRPARRRAAAAGPRRRLRPRPGRPTGTCWSGTRARCRPSAPPASGCRPERAVVACSRWPTRPSGSRSAGRTALDVTWLHRDDGRRRPAAEAVLRAPVAAGRARARLRARRGRAGPRGVRRHLLARARGGPGDGCRSPATGGRGRDEDGWRADKAAERAAEKVAEQTAVRSAVAS